MMNFSPGQFLEIFESTSSYKLDFWVFFTYSLHEKGMNMDWSSRSQIFFNIAVLTFTELQTYKVIKNRLQHKCFPVNIAKFLLNFSGSCFCTQSFQARILPYSEPRRRFTVRFFLFFFFFHVSTVYEDLQRKFLYSVCILENTRKKSALFFTQ